MQFVKRCGTTGASLLAAIGLLGSNLSFASPAIAQSFLPYCQQTLAAIGQKDAIRRTALKGDRNGQQQYIALITGHAQQLQACRQQNWLRNQALWIRLYACDTRPGALEEVLDRIVDRGYNQVYVETFFNGQVLLPQADNPTPWPAMISTPGQERVDLLAEVIRKGRERGLQVYAWFFSLNYGTSYVNRPDRNSTVARNGWGQTTVEANIQAGLSTDFGLFNPNEAFIDPYHPTARQDYVRLVQEVAKRRPDGMLFDYIRYPKGRGKHSLANEVQDLWIYGEASQTALLQRAGNQKGQELIRRYLRQGQISSTDVRSVDQQFSEELEPPLWQGRTATVQENALPMAQRVTILRNELWRLSVSHAMQGVTDFLTSATTVAQQNGLPSGAVFFPDGNQIVGRAFDSRLQPWDRFPQTIEWHPMSYGVCGRVDCITSQVLRTLRVAGNPRIVKPVLAGIWQQSISNRPPLEQQMQGIRQLFPQVNTISHFAYSWQEPVSDRDRKLCRYRPL
jgi:Glycosyl hydrolase-like 10